jgi:hypothetical protein
MQREQAKALDAKVNCVFSGASVEVAAPDPILVCNDFSQCG